MTKITRTVTEMIVPDDTETSELLQVFDHALLEPNLDDEDPDDGEDDVDSDDDGADEPVKERA